MSAVWSLFKFVRVVLVEKHPGSHFTRGSFVPESFSSQLLYIMEKPSVL